MRRSLREALDIEKFSLVSRLRAVKRVGDCYEKPHVENVLKNRGFRVEDPTLKFFFVWIAAQICGAAHC